MRNWMDVFRRPQSQVDLCVSATAYYSRLANNKASSRLRLAKLEPSTTPTRLDCRQQQRAVRLFVIAAASSSGWRPLWSRNSLLTGATTVA